MNKNRDPMATKGANNKAPWGAVESQIKKPWPINANSLYPLPPPFGHIHPYLSTFIQIHSSGCRLLRREAPPSARRQFGFPSVFGAREICFPDVAGLPR